ncbi:MAG: SdrD B-like domain-containing protein, partial [Pseudomonadota bacterium]
MTFSQNAIHGNGGIGIDLGGNGVTANDGLRTTGQPNELWDTPVIESATLSGSTLTVSGYVGSAAGKSTFGGGTVEVFIADATAGNFPAGQTYLGTLTAASNGTFSGQIANVSGVVSGTRLVATAREGNSGYRSTSEFSAARAVVTSVSLSGTVFEDIQYGGGAGRDRATALAAGGSGRPGARVELYDSAGNFVAATTTDSAGAYTFSGLAGATYTVRVVNGTVSSARAGYSAALLPVQTFRTDASSGTVSAVTGRVGGQSPRLADAGNGSTTLAALTTASTTAQSISTVQVGSSNVGGVDFGFSFNVIVNTNDSGQGSLRQFIANANALSNTGLNINGLTDTDVSVFMIPSPADPLGRSADPGYVDGRALIVLTSALPAITGANADGLLLDATTQTSNVGNTNAALLGSGGMVGTPATPLPQLDG